MDGVTIAVCVTVAFLVGGCAFAAYDTFVSRYDLEPWEREEPRKTDVEEE